LLFARNEECGLRCLYHGWKFDVDGNVVEMASEPANSLIPERVKHKAYPTRDAGGFVWAYMGPPDEMSEFEAPAFAPTPDARVSATKVRVRCNWAQILEGQIDSAHSSSLHSSDMVPAQVDSAKAMPEELAASVDLRRAALPDRAHQLRIALGSDPAADQQRGDTRLRPHHRLYRAVHGTDPAEQRA
jgi:phenylpropionate dioxygenase-like ring-hydroxylating dioxygenase large terminal subunit